MIRKLYTAVLLVAGLSGAAPAALAAGPALEIGYLPILSDAQLFVALEDGMLHGGGLDSPKLVSFQSGPAITQALIAGQLDVAYVGIGPALVARAKGADIKVVAANNKGQVSMLALGSLAPYFGSGDPSTAFARFAKDKGRKAVIASYPKGAVPETALQYWLRNVIKADLADIEFVYQGEAQIQQSLMTGAIDGAVVLEPTTTSVQRRVPDARVVANGTQLFPNQPGAVLLVREKLIAEHPEVVRALVQAQIDATKVLRDDPAKAAGYVRKYVGGGRLPADLVEQSIRNSHDQFEPDPRTIVQATIKLQDFQAGLGTQAERVDVGQLFDSRFFESVGRAQ
ncbi:MAG TPA: ABC transporter substrate-binding protein [Bordetella sp.]